MEMFTGGSKAWSAYVCVCLETDGVSMTSCNHHFIFTESRENLRESDRILRTA